VTRGTGKVTIDGPGDANVAPPGWYMVFLVDDQGVPSAGQIVQVDDAGDSEPPTAPASLTATASADGASLDWPAASDNVGVTEYAVYRSTTPGFTPAVANRIARVRSGTAYADRGAAAGTYHYRVAAVDKAGNVGPASPEATVVVTGDTTAPTVSLTTPAAEASLSGSATLTATAADDVGVQNVQFRVDGQDVGAPVTASPFSRAWDTTTVPDGPHTITAVARDASGNATTSAELRVGVHNTGLVAAYGFEEPDGPTAADSVNGFDGQITGATRVPDGRFGKALSFDGTSNWVTVDHRAALDLANGMTLEAWVKPSTLGDMRSVVMKESPGALAYALYASAGTGVPSAHLLTGGDVDALGPAPLTLSQWTHLALTWDRGALRLFIDGAEVTTQPATAPLSTGTGVVRIGGNGVAGQFFSGLIDEVRIYDHARTSAEITADMNVAVRP